MRFLTLSLLMQKACHEQRWVSIRSPAYGQTLWCQAQQTNHTSRNHRLTDVSCPLEPALPSKGLTTGLVKSTNAQIILGNTYHLALRPGSELVQELGGLPKFMGWDGPMLTDSGGFQLFSLAQLTKITEQGATFQSHIDGSKMELTPERSVQIQQELGADIAMVLDHVIELPNEKEHNRRCNGTHHSLGQTLPGRT